MHFFIHLSRNLWEILQFHFIQTWNYIFLSNFWILMPGGTGGLRADCLRQGSEVKRERHLVFSWDLLTIRNILNNTSLMFQCIIFVTGWTHLSKVPERIYSALMVWFPPLRQNWTVNSDNIRGPLNSTLTTNLSRYT